MLVTKHGRYFAIKTVMQLAVLWCYFKYGRSIWNTDPIHVSICNTMTQYWGYYEASQPEPEEVGTTIALIKVNPRKHDSLKSIVETIIHEYVHHLQPIDFYQKYFSLGYVYSDHPFEIEATQIAKNDVDECWEWVTNRLNTNTNEQRIQS